MIIVKCHHVDSNYSLAGLLHQWWGAEQHKAGRCLTFMVVPEHHNAGGFPALVHVVAFVVILEQHKDGRHCPVFAIVVQN